MTGPLLWRRRRVWLPTLWGGLLLLALATGAVVVAAHGAYDWLAPNRPARGVDGGGARTLIVEGWIDDAAFDRAIGAFRAGRYRRVLTTGGPIEPWMDAGDWGSFATRGAAYLRAHGLADAQVVALPAPASMQERTFVSAVRVREWARRSGADLGSVDVFTSGVHARRSRTVYRLALGGSVEVGVLAAPPPDFEAHRWWRSSAGAKATLGELIGVAWTTCCFWPAAPVAPDEPSTVPRATPD